MPTQRLLLWDTNDVVSLPAELFAQWDASAIGAGNAAALRCTNGKYLVFCASHAYMRSMQSHAREWFGGINPEPHCYCAYSAEPEETSCAYRAFVKDESEHLKLLFSINMLNEGVHVQGVSGVVLFRPTVSPIIYKQQIGRALTADTQSTPLILDVVNNFEGLSSYDTLHAEMDETSRG